jgi:multicomponent Na+:H+ antiporter subunit F
MTTLLTLLLAILGVALVFAFVRMIRGPRSPDRLVALEVMSAIGISMMALSAILFDQPVLLDVILVVALVSFIGTVALATFIERRSMR